MIEYAEVLNSQPIIVIEIPKLVFATEQTIWPHEPGIVYEEDAPQGLINELLTKLNPHFEKDQTLKNLANDLGVGRIVKAKLTFPREELVWFGTKNGILIEIADWLTYDRQIESIAHGLSHAAIGPRPENSYFKITGENRTPEIDRKHKLLERVCNYGAGYILNRVSSLGFKSY